MDNEFGRCQSSPAYPLAAFGYHSVVYGASRKVVETLRFACCSNDRKTCVGVYVNIRRDIVK